MTKLVNILGAVGMIGTLLVGSSIPCWRIQTGEVAKKNTIITEDGNIWGYDTEIQAGTNVRVWFHDNDTPDITDDIIWWVQVVN